MFPFASYQAVAFARSKRRSDRAQERIEVTSAPRRRGFLAVLEDLWLSRGRKTNDLTGIHRRSRVRGPDRG